MTKYLLSGLLSILTILPFAMAYNVDDPNFWDGWERDATIEKNIIELMNSKKMSANALLQQATAENPEQSFYVGVLYYVGFQTHAGVIFKKNHMKALQYFNQIKHHRYLMPYVNYYIGMILWSGQDGVTKDKNRSIQFLKTSGTPEAFLMLASIHYENPPQQLYWYKELAYTDDWRAILTVAHWYKIGRGTPTNKGEASYWYNKACYKDIKFACDQLASLTH